MKACLVHVPYLGGQDTVLMNNVLQLPRITLHIVNIIDVFSFCKNRPRTTFSEIKNATEISFGL